MTSFKSRFSLFLLGCSLLYSSANAADVSLRGLRKLGIGFETDAPTTAPVTPVVLPEPEPEPVETVPAPVAAPVEPEPEPEPVPETLPTLADLAMGSPELSVLLDVVTAAGLAPTLSFPGEFTVFAPTNAALEAALDLSLLDQIDPNLLITFLTYHIVPGIVAAEDIEDGDEYNTLQGELVYFSVSDMGVMVNDANVVVADIMASNGVVHVIDRVLYPQALLNPPMMKAIGFTTPSPTVTPPVVLPEPEPVPAPVAAPVTVPEPEPEPVVLPSLAELAATSPNLSKLVAVAVAAGLAPALALPGEFTVLAPTDAAMEAAIDFTVLDQMDTGLLVTFLSYHIIPGTVTSGDIFNGAAIGTLQGEDVYFSVSDTGVMVNDANVVVADIMASNGVVHVIDRVLYSQALLDA